jgi:hypothetical protein
MAGSKLRAMGASSVGGQYLRIVVEDNAARGGRAEWTAREIGARFAALRGASATARSVDALMRASPLKRGYVRTVRLTANCVVWVATEQARARARLRLTARTTMLLAAPRRTRSATYAPLIAAARACSGAARCGGDGCAPRAADAQRGCGGGSAAVRALRRAATVTSARGFRQRAV